MKIGCPKEVKNNEFRVGLTPNAAHAYIQAGHTVFIESGGGQELGRSKGGAQEGQQRPGDGDDKEADHQVMALNAVVSQAKEREEQQNTDYKLQGKYPFLCVK